VSNVDLLPARLRSGTEDDREIALPVNEAAERSGRSCASVFEQAALPLRWVALRSRVPIEAELAPSAVRELVRRTT
jgi:hypothetical protein